MSKKMCKEHNFHKCTVQAYFKDVLKVWLYDDWQNVDCFSCEYGEDPPPPTVFRKYIRDESRLYFLYRKGLWVYMK